MEKLEISQYHWVRPGTPANAVHMFSAAMIRAFSPRHPLNDIYWRCGQIGSLFGIDRIELWDAIKKWLRLKEKPERWEAEKSMEILYEYVAYYGLLPLQMERLIQ